jgi:hypothetical protein
MDTAGARGPSIGWIIAMVAIGAVALIAIFVSIIIAVMKTKAQQVLGQAPSQASGALSSSMEMLLMTQLLSQNGRMQNVGGTTRDVGGTAEVVGARSVVPNVATPLLAADIQRVEAQVDLDECAWCQEHSPDKNIFWGIDHTPKYWADFTKRCGPIRKACVKQNFNYKVPAEMAGQGGGLS